MVDVQVLYQSFRTLRNFAVPAAAVLLIAAGAMLEKGSRLRIFAKAYLFGLLAYALVIGALGVWVAVDFTSFWIKFHHVFFTNDLWILSYATDRMIRIFSESVVSMIEAENLIVIKTLPASANVAAEAIDGLNWSEIAGTLAGENTIFVAVRSKDLVPTVMNRFRAMMK